MTDEPSGSLLCGQCRVPVEGSTDADGIDRVRCPACGRADTLDDAVGYAADHEVTKALDGPLRNLVSKSTPFVQVTVDGLSDEPPRYIVG